MNDIVSCEIKKNINLCTHSELLKKFCIKCCPENFCNHKIYINICLYCNFCKHNVNRNNCKLCSPKNFCKHNGNKLYCSSCFFENQKIKTIKKSIKKEIKRKICEHAKIKHNCTICNKDKMCEHNIKKKFLCKICSPQNYCEHEKLKYYCLTCFLNSNKTMKSAFCEEHLKFRSSCTFCKNKSKKFEPIKYEKNYLDSFEIFENLIDDF